MPLARDVGALIHMVDIQKNTPTQDDSGVPVESWSNQAVNLFARVTTPSGREGFRGGQVDAVGTHVIWMRWRGDITTEMRVYAHHLERTFNVVAIRDPDGTQQFMYLDCKESV